MNVLGVGSIETVASGWRLAALLLAAGRTERRLLLLLLVVVLLMVRANGGLLVETVARRARTLGQRGRRARAEARAGGARAAVDERHVVALNGDRLEWNQRPDLQQAAIVLVDGQFQGELVPKALAIALEEYLSAALLLAVGRCWRQARLHGGPSRRAQRARASCGGGA